MSIAILCLIAAAALVVITKGPLAFAMAKVDGKYDNRTPRGQQSRLEGFGLRALGAHQNSIEAFPVFAAGVLAALWAQADISTVNNLCLVFVAARILYVILYLADVDKLRSVIWTVGLVCCFWLMALAI